MRLCRFNTSRSTPRAVVAQFGRDGCVLLLKYSIKDMLEVVGKTNGKGIFVEYWLLLLRAGLLVQVRDAWSRG